ncbi:MAG: DUF4397 domain-containing protein [Pedobacter sp.]|uniref:DUF4397 domain-containing protein n=1 Tax=Pedobacter sp. TaxID=1411316 RepID=UPI002808C04B|nr:DUF4397 domain-containing protein [Pedobacter sp.]MDQ8005987.1 DUF4397 domain-containing protein [Pedobacter sp.]
MKIKTNHLITRMAVAAAVIFSVSSCSKDDNDNMMNAKLSFVNTVEGSAAQDIFINDSKVSTSAVAYGSSSNEISTSAGDKTISFKDANSATVTAVAEVNTDVNSSHTAFLVKQANGSMGISLYANDNTSASGKAKVRFINVIPMLSSTINVTTSAGTNLISALAFKAASAYQTIDANTSMNVMMTGSLEVTTIAGSELQAGKIYTIWFDSSTTTKAKYHIVVHN